MDELMRIAKEHHFTADQLIQEAECVEEYGEWQHIFADIEKYLTHGMIFRFSSAIKQSVSIRLGDKQIAKLMNDITPISLQSDLDLDKNLSHYDLLDTDQNRLKIRKLFHTSFPQSNLLTFNCSENDQNKYVLEFSVYISYEDLENLWGKLYPKEGMR